MENRVGRAGVEAATAGLADAKLLGDAGVRRELHVGEHRALVDARAEFGGQDVDFESERAHAGLDSEVTKRKPSVAAALERRVGLFGGHLKGVRTLLLEPEGERERDLFGPAQEELRGHRQAGLIVRQEHAPRHADRVHDAALHPPRDSRRHLRPVGIGRVRFERRAAGDIDQIGAELACFSLDVRCGQRHEKIGMMAERLVSILPIPRRSQA